MNKKGLFERGSSRAGTSRRVRRVLSLLFPCLLVTGLNFGEPVGSSAPPPEETMLSLSRDIFLGRVVGSRTYRDSDGDIMTRYFFEVGEVLKGSPPGVFELIEYGGTLGELTMIVSHGAHYQEGGEYLVFAWSDEFGRARTLGGARGALAVVGDDGAKRAVRLALDHPLRSLLGRGAGFLTPYEQIAQAIAKTLVSENRGNPGE